MMKKIALILAGGICFLLFATLCQAQTKGNLMIHATHFNHNNGKAVVHLFRVDDDIPTKPFIKSSAIIKNGNTTITINDLPYGDYAVILFHDENSNGELDHRFGFPNEPMGFSNHWKLSLLSGMPSFQKLKFSFSEDHAEQEIQIK